jgi:hypothetical protein
MAFLNSRRAQFIAWTVIYALAVTLMASKSAEEGMFLIWGLALGVGAGIATCIPGPEAKLQRLLIVALWFFGCWVLALALLWEALGHGTAWNRPETAAVMTLVCGFPALLALFVWIFRRPKLP